MRSHHLSLLLAVSLTASTVSAQSIGVFFDPAGATCSGNIVNGAFSYIYIIALLGGPVAGGMAEAEFRVTGLPAGWIVLSTEASPASNVQLGTPFGTGCAIAFPGCETGATVPLYRVFILGQSVIADQYLHVVTVDPPFSPSYPCPLIKQCDLDFTRVCVSGGEAIINPTGPPCTVGVQPRSWSGVKALYD